ncbi:MAG: guanylate kinase [Clostridiales bacterium]|nr:guanylate kinase [Clostridiales bacterium]
MLVILSAPSGCGKDTVFKELKKTRADVCSSVSATTRTPRAGEIDGQHYYFKTEAQFKDMIKSGELLEYVKYDKSYYGTPISEINRITGQGKICFLIIEVRGAESVMKKVPGCVSVFLMPPSIEILKSRLEKRNKDSAQTISSRMEIAKEEIKCTKGYKYVIENNELEKAVKELNEILDNELAARNK